MNKKDSLGDRMKDYENCYRLYLSKRQPIIIRCDMRAGHTFTKGFERPYDIAFASCMWETARKLCENVGGCRFGYTQSDEITLVLADWENPKTEPWFGNNLQKIVSISASMATLYFNKAFMEMLSKAFHNLNIPSEKLQVYHKALSEKTAIFDSRAFIIPREEIFNVLYWRQLDCKRNSIQLLGQANFSHNQLQNKNSDEIQEMLFQEKGINWAKEPEWFKNGVAIYKKPTKVDYYNKFDGSSGVVYRNKWYADLETPVFTKDKQYIEKYFI